MEANYIREDVPGGVPIKMWTRGVPVEDEARRQLANAARLPIVFKHIAAMPDVHFGIGATVGSVIPTFKAIIPAAVGVDIGCGMMAAKTTLRAEDLPDSLARLRSAIELVEDTRMRFQLNVSEELACEALAYRLEHALAA